jgi:hypothetical protein
MAKISKRNRVETTGLLSGLKSQSVVCVENGWKDFD